MNHFNAAYSPKLFGDRNGANKYSKIGAACLSIWIEDRNGACNEHGKYKI